MSEPERAAAVDALRDLNFESVAFRETVARHFGVGVREAQAASHLVIHGQLSATELGRLTGLVPATTTHLLGRLDRAGLATTAVDPSDLRRTLVRPTERARAMVDQISDWLGRCLDACAQSGIAPSVVLDVVSVLREQLLEVRTSLQPPLADAGRRPSAHGGKREAGTSATSA